MSRKLFGTDGIRGVAGQSPMDAATANALGGALGAWASHLNQHPEVVIGMDTRESGPWLAAQVAGGLARRGVRARFAGITTTPGIAYLTKTHDFVAGVMISASHNPYHDNGLKVFAHTGYKLPDAQEQELETDIFAQLNGGLDPQPLALETDESLDNHYIDFLISTFSGSLTGKRIVVDCANGASCELGPKLFRRLGAEVDAISASPDGRNINLNCGALHLDNVRQRVLDTKADLGIAFDGDADRAMFISHTGKLIDGDHVLLLAARQMKAATVIATVMSNLGLERALQSSGISMIRTPVGDKYVLEEMIRRNAPLGGEQSGHVIFHQYATTGDGLLTAIRVLETIAATGKDLDQLTADFQVYPQILVNVRFKNKRPLEELPTVQAAIRQVESDFGDRGRVLVRFSGTEPLARVMVEGPEEKAVTESANRIADLIRAELS